MVTFKQVTTKNEIIEVSKLARKIQVEHFAPIIGV